MAPPFPKGMMVAMLGTMVIMFLVMGYREQIGGALNGFFHVIDFDGQKPVLTLVIAGLIMITLSTLLRSILTDPVGPAMSQFKQKKFSAEYRQARLDNNLNRMKKFEAMQPRMMEATQNQSSSMMMAMPLTMVVIIPVYAWIYYFVEHTVPTELLTIDMPWGLLGLKDTIVFMPAWIIIYSLISLPIGQLENKLILYLKLGKRADLLAQGITPPEYVPIWKKFKRAS